MLEGGPLPLARALPLALKVSRALMAVHSRGRVLASLRAEDVLVSPFGEVHLLDLGVSPEPASLEVGNARRAEASLVALYASLSPEQVAREGLDERSNLFSLGVLLYELFTGRSPFRDSTPLGTVGRVLSLEPPPASEVNPAIPPDISELLTRLLAKEAEERPPGAGAVVHELEAIAAGTGLEAGALGGEPADLEAQIEHLYDEIIRLAREEPAADGLRRDEEIERAYSRLLELQEAEGERFRRLFEASLAMPIDAGDKILARIRSLRDELEGIASPDPATEDADNPQA
jgi:serine/threonine protein kinase